MENSLSVSLNYIADWGRSEGVSSWRRLLVIMTRFFDGDSSEASQPIFMVLAEKLHVV